MRIRNFDFPGATPEDQTSLLKMPLHKLEALSTLRLSLATVAKFDLLPVFLQRGYLKAGIRASERALGDATARPRNSPRMRQRFSADVIPSPRASVYSVSERDWKGTSAIPAEEISHLFTWLRVDPQTRCALITTSQTLNQTLS